MSSSKCPSIMCDLVKDILVRVLFVGHCGVLLSIVYAYVGFGERRWPYYVYGFLLGLFLLDALWCLCRRKRNPRQFFSPTVALYIMSTVPCVWLIQLEIFETTRNASGIVQSEIRVVANQTSSLTSKILSIDWEPDVWLNILLQIMMFILIIGRWLMPKGKLSRGQLSELLLVHVGMTADILEFLTNGLAMKLKDEIDLVLVLAVWTWSLPQFTLSLTLTKSKKAKSIPGAVRSSQGTGADDYHGCPRVCCATELWSIFLTAILMQDLPFLVLRIYLMLSIGYQFTITEPMVFFASKNILVLLLQMYRMAVIVAGDCQKRRAVKLRDRRLGDTGVPLGQAIDALETMGASCEDRGASRDENGAERVGNAAEPMPEKDETSDSARDHHTLDAMESQIQRESHRGVTWLFINRLKSVWGYLWNIVQRP